LANFKTNKLIKCLSNERSYKCI